MNKSMRRVGDKIVLTYVWLWRECQKCETPARYRISYLLDNARSNPASSGYRKDDISWCSDEDTYACEKHKKDIKRGTPEGHGYAATFTLKRFKHMGFYKLKLSEATA